jgi:hypothetical protein
MTIAWRTSKLRALVEDRPAAMLRLMYRIEKRLCNKRENHRPRTGDYFSLILVLTEAGQYCQSAVCVSVCVVRNVKVLTIALVFGNVTIPDAIVKCLSACHKQDCITVSYCNDVMQHQVLLAGEPERESLRWKRIRSNICSITFDFFAIRSKQENGRSAHSGLYYIIFHCVIHFCLKYNMREGEKILLLLSFPTFVIL